MVLNVSVCPWWAMLPQRPRVAREFRALLSGSVRSWPSRERDGYSIDPLIGARSSRAIPRPLLGDAGPLVWGSPSPVACSDLLGLRRTRVFRFGPCESPRSDESVPSVSLKARLSICRSQMRCPRAPAISCLGDSWRPRTLASSRGRGLCPRRP